MTATMTATMTAMLAVHIAGGTVAVIAGYGALPARRGRLTRPQGR
jgi:hypothetical protein